MDRYVRIAAERHPMRKDELKESPPLPRAERLFAPSQTGCDKIEPVPHDVQLERFKEQLRGLKEKYRPFLKDHTPAPGISRNAVELSRFDFRYQSPEDVKDIHEALDGAGRWEPVVLPDYRGPVGKWTGYYRTSFPYACPDAEHRVYLRFPGVDYIANVYLNDRFIGSHEGFFAPFEFDVTESLRADGGNILLVEVKNDVPTVGIDGTDLNGDKLYAATGLGWDDPKEGWHHCPPGAGVYHKVLLEERASCFVDSLFVRPDIDGTSIEARILVSNTLAWNAQVQLALSIYPYNFQDGGIRDIALEPLESAGPGMNEYRFSVDMPGFRLWRPEEPWLYCARISLLDQDKRLLDQYGTVFGMRKFHMDEAGEEKGTLFLNNRPVILRGANDMGHMQQCVLRGDFDQLAEDILIARLANMNFYRFTQRPVQEEIYHYCDMLGMMNQTDFPLFGYLRRNQFCDALRQVGEMERLVRSHPSCIMVSYINEPFSAGQNKLGHRHLFRDELEAFFEAADRVVRVENPDRVIKHVEGDYDPPTGAGLSDFHCYTMWYTNHALPIGKLYKGFLPATKTGWKTGCGEYGTEGLDNAGVMARYYPKEWLPADPWDAWIPDRIVLAQTNSMHGDWYEEQHTMAAWIGDSQRHQAFATALMTDALRRRSDRVVSTAVHLLIDAWPSGWMKTLVGVDRVPKPAYFSFRDSLSPFRINLRCDRWTARSGEEIGIEAWLLNDTPDDLPGCRISATFRDHERDFSSHAIQCDGKAVFPSYAGTVRVCIPEVQGRKTLFLDAGLWDARGNLLSLERFAIEAFEARWSAGARRVACLGARARRLAAELGYQPVEYLPDSCEGDMLVISDRDSYGQMTNQIENSVLQGLSVLFLLPDAGCGIWEFMGEEFTFRTITGNEVADGAGEADREGLFFLARNANDARTCLFKPGDFAWWYDAGNDRIEAMASCYLDAAHIDPLLFTYRKPSFIDRTTGEKPRLPVVGERSFGKGRVQFSALRFENRVAYNPALENFLRNLL